MTNNNTYLLSIGIPTYKRPLRLRKCLDSITRQTVIGSNEWEVVVTDNCSSDDTKKTVEEYLNKIPNLRYFCNSENIGGDQNLRSLFEKCSGEYIWTLPDDDWIESEGAVEVILNKLKSNINNKIALLLMGLVAKDLNTQKKVELPAITSTLDDILVKNGRDILAVVNEYDLIGVQRMVLRKDVLPDPFVDKVVREYISPIAICLVAGTKGSILIVGETLVAYGAGDSSAWRVRWPEIALQRIPNLLKDAVNILGYPPVAINRRNEYRKSVEFNALMYPSYLLFRRHGVSWRSLAEHYGTKFVFKKVLMAIPRTVLHFIDVKIINKLKTA